jgi:quinol-cytochrome oxidoreductase complex cytochrome b subunit
LPSTAQDKSLVSALTSTADYFKTRITNIDIFDEHYQNEARANPFYALGPIFYLVWFIVIATGLILIMWYVPTKASAYDSILNIQNGIPIGGLMRGMHKYGADAMIIAATMRLYRMFINGDFKPSKELNIAIGLVTLLLSMYSGLTGYLLIWNQRAFWATKVFATFPTYMDQFALMGDFYQPLYKSLHLGWNTAEVLLGGGAAITQNTITRFFSLHCAFTLIPLIFVELYFYKNAYKRVPLNWTKRTIIILMLAFVAIALPAAQGSRSDPDVTPLPILSDWYFLGLYQMYKYLEPVVATYITMVIPVSVILLPFIDTLVSGQEKNILKRPFMLMVTIMGGVTWVVFSILIIINVANIHTDPPYWRSFFYLTLDLGVVWQLFLIMSNKDLVAKGRQLNSCAVLAVVALIQCFWGFTYTYMAKTEIFIDPLGHGALYAAFRPFMGGAADQAEALVRKMYPPNGDPAINKEYWNYHVILDSGYITKVGEPAGKADLEAIKEVAKSTSPIDWAIQLMPTFETADGPNDTLKAVTFSDPKIGPHPKYLGLVDFMVNNRWCMDYCVLQDRLAGKVKPYPLVVPSVDNFWIYAGPITLLYALYVASQCKEAQKAKPVKPETAKPAEVAST